MTHTFNAVNTSNLANLNESKSILVSVLLAYFISYRNMVLHYLLKVSVHLSPLFLNCEPTDRLIFIQLSISHN